MSKFLWVIFAGYLVSWVISFFNFESRRERLESWQKKILITGLFLHFGILVCYAVRGVSTVGLFIELVAPFLILVIAAIMEWRLKIRFFILFALPGALLITFMGILHQEPAVGLKAWAEGAWFWAHIIFIIAGFVGFFTALSSALMYLMQSRQLKSKHPGRFLVKLPALDTLDKVHFRSLVWGSILFSLGILSGLFWATHLQKLGPLVSDPTVILSVVTCVLYWIIIGLRLSSLRRGQRIVAGTLVVFVLLFATMMTSHMVTNVSQVGL